MIAGKYAVGERIGSGGMGAVYQAMAPGLTETVAIKLLHPQYADDPAFLRRFQDEALAASRVSHPGAVAVLESGQADDGTAFIVMEHVRGEHLGRLARRRLPLARVIDLVHQLLVVLAEVHAAGVIHGDVKTDNVLVEVTARGDRVRLIDFGLARFAGAAPHGDDTNLAEVSGTPEYMAPEVVAGALPTPAADLYGAGVILYELLVGATPFAGGSAAAVMKRHLHDEVVPPSLRSPDRGISSALERVVLRALAKEPHARFPSAASFAAALAEALASLPSVYVRAPEDGGGAYRADCPTRPWPGHARA